jgi:hypothetical protein
MAKVFLMLPPGAALQAREARRQKYPECKRRRTRRRSLHDAPGINRHGGHEGGMKMADLLPSETQQTLVRLAPRPSRPLAHTFGLPPKQGLYDPRNEHDACGVGFVAHMKGEKSHQIVRDGLFMLENLTHRGAVGADPLMGDGAGHAGADSRCAVSRGNARRA